MSPCVTPHHITLQPGWRDIKRVNEPLNLWARVFEIPHIGLRSLLFNPFEEPQRTARHAVLVKSPHAATASETIELIGAPPV